ncbi:MAG TPA: GAF and ANTAR domain-containing protein [Nocardioidaceae bacterium]
MSGEPLLETAARLSDRLTPGDLDATLSRITEAAVELIPDTDYASISLRHDQQIETVSATDPLVNATDDKQYALREGPCYDAATDTPQVVSPDLRHDGRFPAYGPFAADLGVAAQAAFRLYERGTTQAALNLYSTTMGAFTDLASTAALFRSEAAVAIAYAHEITNLKEALETRTTIGQAVGLVMERYQLNDERAFAFLTRLSQHRNVKLRLVAEELVAELAGRSGTGPGTRLQGAGS